jgi:hypothetical protein
MYIKLPFDQVFRFDGPHGRLKIDICSNEIERPGKDPVTVYAIAARGANDSEFDSEGNLHGTGPLDDTFVQLSGPFRDWATVSNARYHGFEVPDFLQSQPETMSVVECLRRTPEVIVSNDPLPPAPPLRKFEPYPEPKRWDRAIDGEPPS